MEEDLYERKRINRNRLLLFTPIAAALVFLFIFLSWQYFGETSSDLFTDGEETPELKMSDQARQGSEAQADASPKGTVANTNDSSNEPEETETDLDQKLEERTDKKKALYYEPPKLTYYLIAGSFQELSNARRLMNQLNQKGYPSEILQRNGEGYRVAIESYDKKEKAMESLYRLRKSYSKDIWVLEAEK